MTEPPAEPTPGSDPGTGEFRPRRRDTADLPVTRRRAPRPEGGTQPTERLTPLTGTQPTERLTTPIGTQPTERLTPLMTERRTVPAGPSSDTVPAERTQKRVAVLPIALAATGIVLAGVLAFVIVGLAVGQDSAPIVASATPSVTLAAPAPAAPIIVPPQRDAGQNECVDSTGDGGTVDLSAVRLEPDNKNLTATFELAQPLPAGEASVGIYAESENGRRSYQFATVWTDGELDRFFAHDFAKGHDEGLAEDEVRVDGASIVVVIPDDYLKRLGNSWTWYAFSTAAGADVDACPGDPLSFESLTFETPRGDTGGG